MALHLPIGPLKTHSGVGAGTEVRTQYLPLADDITTAPSGLVGAIHSLPEDK